jgi:hypothetical protein
MEPEQGEALIDDGSGSFKRYSISLWQLAFPLLPSAYWAFLNDAV